MNVLLISHNRDGTKPITGQKTLFVKHLKSFEKVPWSRISLKENSVLYFVHASIWIIISMRKVKKKVEEYKYFENKHITGHFKIQASHVTISTHLTHTFIH